jgi:hypothetical protein
LRSQAAAKASEIESMMAAFMGSAPAAAYTAEPAATPQLRLVA